MTQSFKILPLRDEDTAHWDRYVLENDAASFFHRSQWRNILQDTLGHPTYYFAAWSENKVVGILPLVHVKSMLFGNSLSSLAFGAYGGAVADYGEIHTSLESAAITLGQDLGVGSIEFRYRKPTGETRPTKLLYSRFLKEIHSSEEENMQAIRGKQRNVIRKGLKNGLQLVEDDLDSFYDIYAESVRNLGTPVFPKKLFESILKAFPEETEILSVTSNGNAVSSALIYYHGQEVCPYFWGGKFAARSLKANDVLAWKIMCRAAEKGFNTFDFGRSKTDTGAFQWKLNLGFKPYQLYYEYELIRDKEMPEINPSNPKYRLFIDAWKRLPLGFSKLVGPAISKNLG